MCLWFAFLLITRMTKWLRLSRREEAWQTAEILILRHQLAVLRRRQPRRPHLNWADREMASQAETVARSITDPDRQVQALVAVAKALVAMGDPKRARHVVSVACAVGSWTTALELVLLLEPSALRVLTNLELRIVKDVT